MKKYIISLISLFFIFQMFLIKAHSYQTFDGKYNYNSYGEQSSNYVKTDSNDEEVLFIVDFSSSMNKKMGYTPKIYHAIDAIRDILSEAGDTAKIGLRVFGVTDKPMVDLNPNGVSYSLNKKNLCSASSLVLPIAKYNRENISNRLSRLTPNGVTPIGYSLRQAVQNDFSPNSNTIKHIILITDGNENCGDDPCLFIKRLMQMRDDFKIDVIGITVDENAYSQLHCIASAAKGEYYSVNSPDEFTVKFKQAFNSTTKITKKTNPVKVITHNNSPNSRINYKNYAFRFDY